MIAQNKKTRRFFCRRASILMIALNFSLLTPQPTRSPRGDDDGGGDGCAGSYCCHCSQAAGSCQTKTKLLQSAANGINYHQPCRRLSDESANSHSFQHVLYGGEKMLGGVTQNAISSRNFGRI